MGIDLGPFFAAIVAALRSLIRCGTVSESAATADGTVVALRLDERERDHVTVLATIGEQSEHRFGTLFWPAAARPSSYPTDLPFVPDSAVVVSDLPDDACQCLWPFDQPGAPLARAAVSDSSAAGWRLDMSLDSEGPTPVRYAGLLRKPTRVRTVWGLDVLDAPASLLLDHLRYEDPAAPAT